MKATKAKFEKQLEVYAQWLCQYPKLVITGMLILTLVLGGFAVNLRVDMSNDANFRKDDPVFVTYEAFRKQFGRDEIIMVTITPPQVFDPQFLKDLQTLHKTLEKEVPYIDDVTSLINITSIEGKEKELLVGELFKNWPETKEDLEIIKNKVLSNHQYRDFLISEDGKTTALVIRSVAFIQEGGPKGSVAGDEFIEDEESNSGVQTQGRLIGQDENSEFALAIKRIADDFQKKHPDSKVYYSGFPLLVDDIVQAMNKEAPVFILASGLFVVFLLYYLFKRVSCIIYPLSVVYLPLIATMGLMGIFDAPVTTLTQALPQILLAVAIGDSVHFLSIFFMKYDEIHDKKASLVYSMGHSGLGMIMTSLTTAAGLYSFATSTIPPISDMGIFGGTAVMLALLYTFTFLPAAIYITPLKEKPLAKGSVAKLDNMIAGMGNIAIRYPWTVILISAITGVIGLYGTSLLKFSHDPLRWFHEDEDPRAFTEKVDELMKGAMSMEILVDTQRVNGLYEPEILNKIEAMETYAKTLRDGNLYIGKASSIVDTIKEIHQALNENNPEYYKIPQDKNLIAQELFLFSSGGSDDLEEIIDNQYSMARVTFKLPWTDANETSRLVSQLENKFKETFEGTAKITVTGVVALLTRVLANTMESMVESYIIAAGMITLFMIITMGSLRIGLLSMMPNFLPVILGMALMGFCHIPLDMASIIIACIVMGLVVDDTTHFIHNFLRYFHQNGDAVSAVQRTLQTVGRSMLFTSIVLSGSFFVFLWSSLNHMFIFGLISGFIVVVALLYDLILSPAMMIIIARTFKNV
ncbi:MMPL family transporter [Deltaproteobacteria bacterium TL4]